MEKKKRQPDRNKGVLVRFPPDVQESLELFAQEQKVSLTHVVTQMFRNGFENWRAGKFNVPVNSLARHFGEVSVTMKKSRMEAER